FTAPPTPGIYTLSLHDALPIYCGLRRWKGREAMGTSPASSAGCPRAGATAVPSAPGIHVLNTSRQPCSELRRGNHLGRIRLARPDRKSTRLNSSHVKISYAVFC